MAGEKDCATRLTNEAILKKFLSWLPTSINDSHSHILDKLSICFPSHCEGLQMLSGYTSKSAPNPTEEILPKNVRQSPRFAPRWVEGGSV
jgi:hypothetical protein